mmetsp:Transcript_28889/g.93143  ORF Transcript_28889/g.93143 Transcript_28889/m.93143 type:complete len:101 (+) Transcript_28889:339-641(+)
MKQRVRRIRTEEGLSLRGVEVGLGRPIPMQPTKGNRRFKQLQAGESEGDQGRSQKTRAGMLLPDKTLSMTVKTEKAGYRETGAASYLKSQLGPTRFKTDS